LKLDDIKIICNIGAGTMGHAIALQFAMNGYQVNFLDTSEYALTSGLDKMKADLKTFRDANMLHEDDATILSRIHATTDYAVALESADFVIESVVEDLEVKRGVWQKVEENSPKEIIMATNSSGLSPSAIQEGLKNPSNFVVAHFWNPAQLMPLVEVVPGNQTSDEAVQVTQELMSKIGKHAVAIKKESLGFVGNRIQLAVLREALHIVDEGIATPEAVDDIIKYSLGRRWSLVGPIASADLGGLDIFKNISSYLYADLSSETGTDKSLSKMVEANKLGLKTGEGYFDWNGDEGKQMVADRDAKLLELLKED